MDVFPRQALSEIIAGFDAGVSVNAEDRPARRDEKGVLKVSAIGIGRFRPPENKAVKQRDLDRVGPVVSQGDILISRANTQELVGAAAEVDVEMDNLHLSDKTWRVRLRQHSEANRRWLPHVLNSGLVRKELRRLATGTSGSMKNISQETYLGIRVPVPPEAERAHIADTLDTFALRERLVGRLITAKRLYRQALAQCLFADRSYRGVGSYAALSRVPLREYLTENRETASTGAHARKLTIRLYGRGVVANDDLRPGSPNTQYYRRRVGQFVYSKLDFLNGAFGIVPPELDGYESTLDLPAFDVSPRLHAPWLLQLLSRPEFYKGYNHLANGGRKARRVNPSAFLGIVIDVPPFDQQRRVAGLLGGLDREIALYELLQAYESLQRKFVVDRVITGEIRLKRV